MLVAYGKAGAVCNVQTGQRLRLMQSTPENTRMHLGEAEITWAACERSYRSNPIFSRSKHDPSGDVIHGKQNRFYSKSHNVDTLFSRFHFLPTSKRNENTLQLRPGQAILANCKRRGFGVLTPESGGTSPLNMEIVLTFGNELERVRVEYRSLSYLQKIHSSCW